MNRALWIAKKNELCSLIKKVSDLYGGDDLVWLKEYAKEVIEVNRDGLDTALACFRELERQAKYCTTNVSRRTQGSYENENSITDTH
jgi:hypothetical protein